MANSVSASFQEIFAKEYQQTFYRKNVAKKVVEMSFKSGVANSNKYSRSYAPTNYGKDDLQTYVRGTAIAISDMTDTKETLTIDRQFADGKYVDNFDQLQTNLEFAAKYGENMAAACSDQMDADILGEWDQATSTVDDGSLGGTAGNGIQLTTANILKVFSSVKLKLQKQNVGIDELYGVISPEVEQVLIEYSAGRDTGKGDQSNEDGRLMRFYGIDLYVSNLLGTSAVLFMAAQPTDGDTVVINGVTFTFKTTLGSTAGNVLIGASADIARANLAALINDPATTTANGVALTAANQRIMRNCTATNDNTDDTLTLDFKGLGVIIVSETLTAAADIWQSGKTRQHALFGRKKAIFAVVQKEAKPELKEVPDKLGKNLLVGILYGFRSFADSKPQTVNVAIDTSSFA